MLLPLGTSLDSQNLDCQRTVEEQIKVWIDSLKAIRDISLWIIKSFAVHVAHDPSGSYSHPYSPLSLTNLYTDVGNGLANHGHCKSRYQRLVTDAVLNMVNADVSIATLQELLEFY